MGQLTEGGGDLLQGLIVLAQESPLVSDHSPERLCVCWVHLGQFALLRYRLLGPKCRTQGGGDRVKAKGIYLWSVREVRQAGVW